MITKDTLEYIVRTELNNGDTAQTRVYIPATRDDPAGAAAERGFDLFSRAYSDMLVADQFGVLIDVDLVTALGEQRAESLYIRPEDGNVAVF